MDHAGEDIYKYCTCFTVYYIWKQLVLYYFDCIAPSPRKGIKFKIHDEYQVNDGNLCENIFGTSYTKSYIRSKNLKRFGVFNIHSFLNHQGETIQTLIYIPSLSFYLVRTT